MTKTCPICGVTFFPSQKHQIYCNRSCNLRHHGKIQVHKQRLMMQRLKKYLSSDNPTIDGVKAIVL